MSHFDYVLFVCVLREYIAHLRDRMMAFARANKPLSVADVELMFPYPIDDLVTMNMIKTPPIDAANVIEDVEKPNDNNNSIPKVRNTPIGPPVYTDLQIENEKASGEENDNNNSVTTSPEPEIVNVNDGLSGDDNSIENNATTLNTEALTTNSEELDLHDDDSTILFDYDLGFHNSPNKKNITTNNSNQQLHSTLQGTTRVTGKSIRQEILDSAKETEDTQTNTDSQKKPSKYCVGICHLIYEENQKYCSEGNRLYKKKCITCQSEVTKELFKEKNTIVYCSKLDDGINELYKCTYVECLNCKADRENGFDDDKPIRKTRSRRAAAV